MARRPKTPHRHPVDLALQGGGSHGAFTWGVLDRLLQERDLVLSGVSGTSAGALNAVALASGLMSGGREGARQALRRLWEAVGGLGLRESPFAQAPGATPPWQAWWPAAMVPWASTLGGPGARLAEATQAWWGDLLTRTFSPYQLNPLNLNPLRDVLLRTVDFDAVRQCDKLRVFVSATHVRSGRLRLFRQHELSVDVVLASACLPLLFQAVEVDGEAYWDGGFAGNPSLLPLVAESPGDDLLLIQINPQLRDAAPTQARDILERMNEITFNTSLLKELRSIALLKLLMASEGLDGRSLKTALLRHMLALRVHRIEGGEALAALGSSSKADTRPSLLNHLHGIGRDAADAWLRQHRQDLGQRSTVDLERECLG